MAINIHLTGVNSKFESLNTKQTQNSNVQSSWKKRGSLKHLNFAFGICLGFRV